MEHEREIIQLEGFLIVIAVAEVFNVISKLSEENKVIGNKGEEDLTAILADTLCFADTFLLVRITKLSTTTSSGGLILALLRAIDTARPEGRCRKHCYWSAIKRYLSNLLSLILLLAL